MATSRLPYLLAGSLILLAPLALAQQRDRSTRQMVRGALEEYQNLEVDQALSRLRMALNGCGRTNCSPGVLASVHMALGVVIIGAQNDVEQGTGEFVEALRLDPDAEPDAMLVTPEITQALEEARRRISSGSSTGGGTSSSSGSTSGGSTGTTGGRTTGGGTSSTSSSTTGGRTNTTSTSGGGSTSSTTGGAGSSSSTGSTSTGGTSTGGTSTGGTSTGGTSTGGTSTGARNLLHTPPSEQLENTPLPVYVEPGNVTPTRVVLHYRGLGMQQFGELDMPAVGQGFGIEIPCGQVIQPHMDYFITALDAAQNVLAGSGTAQSPLSVRIVTQRSVPAPALPGRMPPQQCQEDCPPGMTGPQCAGNRRGRGANCSRNEQCESGLRCEANVCAEGPANSSGGGGYHFAVDIGGGVGLNYVGGTTNSDPNANPPDYSWAEYNDYGSGVFTCGEPTADNPGGSFRCPGYIRPGFAPMGFVYGSLRAHFWRLGLGVSVRFQPDAALVGTIPFMFLGGRVYFAFLGDGWNKNGLTLAAFVGSGFGQMQPRIPVQGGGEGGHLVSGLNNVHVGIHGEYGLAKFIHIGVDLTGNFMVPSFMFVLDGQLSAGVHF